MAQIVTPDPVSHAGTRGLSFALGTKFFNQPLAMEIGFASHLRDALVSRAFDSDQAVISASKFAGTVDRQSRYRVTDDGIAIVPVQGMLIDRGAWLGDLHGFATSYEGLTEQLRRIGKDDAIKAVVLDIDTPGGMVAGLFDVCDAIAKLNKKKPVSAIAANMAASAGYAIASCAGEVYATGEATVGSIGVVMMHTSYAGALQNAGVEVTFVHSGAHKVDGNPYQPLSHGARSEYAADSDHLYDLFVRHVAKHRRLDEAAVRATEARVYFGRKAVDLKLADGVKTFDELLAHVRKSVKATPARGKSPRKGGRMSENTPAAGRSDSNASLTDVFASLLEARDRVAGSVELATLAVPAPIASVPVTPVSTENGADPVARVFAILDHEEGKKRPVAARKVAEHTTMGIEEAVDFLAAMPAEGAASNNAEPASSAQVGTALDREMAKPGNSAGVKPDGAGASAPDEDRLVRMMAKSAKKRA